jgi:hypothetical protein
VNPVGDEVLAMIAGAGPEDALVCRCAEDDVPAGDDSSEADGAPAGTEGPR